MFKSVDLPDRGKDSGFSKISGSHCLPVCSTDPLGLAQGFQKSSSVRDESVTHAGIVVHRLGVWFSVISDNCVFEHDTVITSRIGVDESSRDRLVGAYAGKDERGDVSTF